jgi:peptidyl-prolyl cis-trans isomerase D
VLGETLPAFADYRHILLDQLQIQGAESLFVAASEQMADIAFTSPDLQELTDELQLQVQLSDWFTADGVNQFGDMGSRVAEAAFSNDVLIQGNNSEVITLAHDKMLVLNIANHREAQAQAFAEVKEHIEHQLQQKQAAQQLRDQANDYKAKLQDGTDMAEIVTQSGVEWMNLDKLTRLSNAMSPTLSQAVFKLPRPTTDNVYDIVVDYTGDVSVLALKEVYDADLSTLSEEQQTGLRSALSRLQGQNDIIAFDEALTSKAHIERF